VGADQPARLTLPLSPFASSSSSPETVPKAFFSSPYVVQQGCHRAGFHLFSMVPFLLYLSLVLLIPFSLYSFGAPPSQDHHRRQAFYSLRLFPSAQCLMLFPLHPFFFPTTLLPLLTSGGTVQSNDALSKVRFSDVILFKASSGDIHLMISTLTRAHTSS